MLYLQNIHILQTLLLQLLRLLAMQYHQILQQKIIDLHPLFLNQKLMQLLNIYLLLRCLLEILMCKIVSLSGPDFEV